MALYGIIDLGSNSIRLVVYEANDNAKPPFSKRDFHSIINEKTIAGLSAYVQDGTFTQAGINRAAEVLGEHLRRAHNVGCENVRIFATAVLRNCSNSAEATRAISEAVSMPIDVLSACDEAHLGFAGATCDRSIERGTLIDIGGGSTELTAVRKGADSCGISLGQGSVSSYAQFVRMILPTADEVRAIQEAFRTRLAELESLEPYRCASLYGTGGSTRAAAKMYGVAFGGGVRPKSLERHQLDAIIALLMRDPSTFAHLAVKAAPDRLHTLVPGCLIAHVLMEQLSASTLEICKYGVREGYLIERILGA